jgi:NAD-dependent DNA ligase
LKIENIGYQTLETLYKAGLLDKGIRSLYKLKKKTHEIEDLDGLGRLKARKIVNEIESKRRLKDYEFFGSIGIEGLSIKTFKSIFTKIKLNDFINMIELKNYGLLLNHLVLVDGIADKKAELLIDYLKEPVNRIEIQKLIDELSIYETHGEEFVSKGTVVFSGHRDESLRKSLISKGYTVNDSWTNKAAYLVVKDKNDESTKIIKAKERNIPILSIDEAFDI